MRFAKEADGSPEPPLDPVAGALLRRPDVIEAVSAGPTATAFVEHLVGTDLYQLYTIQGTLHEQASVFVRADAHGSFSILPTPASARGGSYTTIEDLGMVGDRPFVIDHGPNDPQSPDEDIQLTPWMKQGFGPACRVALRFNNDYRIADRYGDPSIAAAGTRAALAFARSLDAGDAREPRDGDDAHIGLDTLQIGQTEFPTFGHERFPPGWNYNDGRTARLIIAARPLIAIYGHAGVGWRSGTTILVALYRDDQRRRTPVASFVIKRFVTGLRALLQERGCVCMGRLAAGSVAAAMRLAVPAAG